MNSNKTFSLIIFFLFFITILSCTKFLDEKPNGNITTPSTLDDLEELLDNYTRLNGRSPSAGEVSSDNYYLSDASWNSATEAHRDYYLWQKFDGTNGDWNSSYVAIFYSNIILEGVDKINSSNAAEIQKAEQLQGAALFYRAYYHYTLAQLFADTYDSSKSADGLGLPLKRTSDMNEKIIRSSVKETYDFIISDILQSLKKLPLTSSVKYRPNLPAAYGLMSRVYMSMQQYKKAGIYADSCLRIYDSLMNYNSLDSLSPAPFAQFNEEVIFDMETTSPSALDWSRAKVDTFLYKEYANNDLRKSLFFINNTDGSHTFKGNYTGLSNASMFTGLATDEMMLNRAEAYARAGDSVNATKDLNKMLNTRWKKETFITISFPISGGLLNFILKERRKELLFRELRWTDLRRLNKEREFSDTLYRYINDQQYKLLPNSSSYLLQIPKSTIEISDIMQNP